MEEYKKVKKSKNHKINTYNFYFKCYNNNQLLNFIKGKIDLHKNIYSLNKKQSNKKEKIYQPSEKRALQKEEIVVCQFKRPCQDQCVNFLSLSSFVEWFLLTM